uniref:Uncharacterized protein n=1 Tax=Octopus bimaculoides TaxID=37653 RepID=A0A0L8FSC8_OCTBM
MGLERRIELCTHLVYQAALRAGHGPLSTDKPTQRSSNHKRGCHLTFKHVSLRKPLCLVNHSPLTGTSGWDVINTAFVSDLPKDE